MPTVLQKLNVCPLGMCMVLALNIGISTSVPNTTQILLVLPPAYSTLHRYAHNTSETQTLSELVLYTSSDRVWRGSPKLKQCTVVCTDMQ